MDICSQINFCSEPEERRAGSLLYLLVFLRRYQQKLTAALRVAATMAAHVVKALDRSFGYALRASPSGAAIVDTQQMCIINLKVL